MRINIKKLEVVIPTQKQQLLGLQTAKVFQRELERISGADVASAGNGQEGPSRTWTRAEPKAK